MIGLVDTIDVAVSTAWISLSLILVLTGLLLAWSRLGSAATLIYIGGLLLLAFSIFRVHPALVRAPLSEDVVELREALLLVRGERDQLRSDLNRQSNRLTTTERQLRTHVQSLSALEGALHQVRHELSAEQLTRHTLEGQSARQASALTAFDRRVTRLRIEVDRVRAELLISREKNTAINRSLIDTAEQLGAAIAQSSVFETKYQETMHQFGALREQYDNLRGQLEKTTDALRSVSARLGALEAQLELEVVSQSRTPLLEPKHISDLRLALRSGVTKDTYSVTPHDLKVEGRGGSFYAVVLKNVSTGSAFRFKSRQFQLGDEEAQLIDSFNAFASELLLKLSANSTIEMFVRGRADGGGPIGPLPSSAISFQRVPYLPNKSSAYDQRYVDQVIVDTVDNRHLPVLRAASIRALLARAGYGIELHILEGLTVSGTDETQRTFELFLHIPAT